ncbi:cytochrome P450 6k1 [Diachasma alloeum]|uniref:cytochrome P450 6k1 n=1 Tax=Diachasma alloeum TaxID=454923 RepID=UPI00073818BB|nr:cytochrome P450 6k1 [Diachasma alloeum]
MVRTWNHWTMETGVLILLIVYLIYRYMTRNFGYWKARGVVCVSPSPFFGSFGDFLMGRKSVGGFLWDVYNYSKDAPYVGFFGFDKPMLLVRDPGLIKQILIKDFDYFKDRYADAGAHDVLGSANLFIIKNPQWKYLRTKMSPIYTSGRLRKMVKLMAEVGEDLVTHIDSLNLRESGRTIEVKELCAKFATDMIATTAFGMRANCLNNPDAEFRKYGKEVFQHTFYRSVEQISTFFAPFLMTPLKFNIFSKRVSKFLRSALWEAITNREKCGVKRHDLIDLLIELKNQDVNNPDKSIFAFEGDNIVAQAAVFFTAGFETSSTPLSFTLYELALHPKIQDRLRKEITDAVEESGGEITYDMIVKLPYLDMVLSESLRKYPPLPILDRVADSDYRVPGSDLVIEKGTPVFVSLFGLHYDPKYHENPEKFDPERFSDANKETTKKAWYAFGDGPHVCIGLRLGLLQSKMGLISILQKYEVYPCEKTAIPMKFHTQGLMTSAAGGLYLNIKKIKN